MISCLTGKKIATLPTGIILDVHGVGYSVEMPLSSLCHLPDNAEFLTIFTHTYIRQDILRLYGFISFQEKIAFEILISLNGVGPKVALAILSTLPLEGMKKAVKSENQAIFQSVPGIGKRLAEKILVELKSKISKLDSAGKMEYKGSLQNLPNINVPTELFTSEIENQEVESNDHILEDVKSALMNLGFKEKNISANLEVLFREEKNISFESLMKKALISVSNVKEMKKSTDSSRSTSKDFGSDLF